MHNKQHGGVATSGLYCLQKLRGSRLRVTTHSEVVVVEAG